MHYAQTKNPPNREDHYMNNLTNWLKSNPLIQLPQYGVGWHQNVLFAVLLKHKPTPGTEQIC
jgi:hypothetical protein